MPLAVAYSGVLSHICCTEWTDQLRLRPPEELDVLKPVRIARFMVSDYKDGMEPPAEKPDGRLVEFLGIPSGGDSEVVIGEATLNWTDSEPFEVAFDEVFITDKITVKGCYEKLCLQIDIETDKDEKPGIFYLEEEAKDEVELVEEDEEVNDDEDGAPDRIEIIEIDDDTEPEAADTGAAATSQQNKEEWKKKRAEEREKQRQLDEVEALAIEGKHFSVDDYEPRRLKCRRPPWRESAVTCEGKAWELFCDAVASFDRQPLEELVDDWVVTVESLLPELRACLREAAKKAVPDEKVGLPGMLADWASFALSLDITASQAAPAHFLRVGLHLVEEIARHAFDPNYAIAVLEHGVAWNLVLIADSGFTQLHQPALNALHALQSCRGAMASAAFAFFRPYQVEKEREGETEEATENTRRESENEAVEMKTTIYERVASIVAMADEHGDATSVLSLCLRILSRATVNRIGVDLVHFTREYAPQPVHDINLQNEFGFMITTFIEKFNECLDVSLEYGKVDEMLRTYAVLAECNWTAVMCIVLSQPLSWTLERAFKFTADAIDQQECVGLFAISECPAKTQKLLLRLLQLVEEAPERSESEREEGEKDDTNPPVIFQSPTKRGRHRVLEMQVQAPSSEFAEDVLVPRSGFNEGASLIRHVSGRELASRIAFRLRVLQLADLISYFNRSLCEDMLDSPDLFRPLHALTRLLITSEGEDAVSFVFGECAFSQLVAIVALKEDSDGGKKPPRIPALSFRYTPALCYALELLIAISSRVRSGRFWLRNAKHFNRLVKLSSNKTKEIISLWWEHFRESANWKLAHFNDPSEALTLVRGFKTKLLSWTGGLAVRNSKPSGIPLLRLLAHFIDPANVTTEVEKIHRSEFIGHCIKEGLDAVLEDILQKSTGYQLTFYELGRPIMSTECFLFRETILPVLSALTTINQEVLLASKTAKRMRRSVIHTCVSLWDMTTGFSGANAEVGTECCEIRRAILLLLRTLCGWRIEEELEVNEEGKTAAVGVVRCLLDKKMDIARSHVSILTILWMLQPGSVVACEGDANGKRIFSVFLRQYFEALAESAKPIAQVFLTTAPYARQFAHLLFPRFISFLPRSTLNALAKAMWLAFGVECSTRPTSGSHKKKSPTVDQPDIALPFARSRQALMLDSISLFISSSKRFKLALFHNICSDEQCLQRVSIFASLFHSFYKQPSHLRFQEIASFLILSIVNYSLYNEVNEDKDDAKAEEDEFMEAEDDRDVIILEDDDGPEEKVDDDKDGLDKSDICLRLVRSLVRLATQRASSIDQSLLALRSLHDILAQNNDRATDTIRRAWYESRLESGPRVLFCRLSNWLFPLKGPDAKNGRTTIGPCGSLLSTTTEHLFSLFGSVEQCRLLYELLELDAVEYPKNSEIYEKYLAEQKKKKQRAEERKKKRESEKSEAENRKDEDEDQLRQDEEILELVEEELGEELLAEEDVEEKADDLPVHPAVRLLLRLRKREEERGMTAEAAIARKLTLLVDMAEKGRQLPSTDENRFARLNSLRLKEVLVKEAEAEEVPAREEKLIVNLSVSDLPRCIVDEKVQLEVTKYTKNGKETVNRLRLSMGEAPAGRNIRPGYPRKINPPSVKKQGGPSPSFRGRPIARLVNRFGAWAYGPRARPLMSSPVPPLPGGLPMKRHQPPGRKVPSKRRR